MGQAVAAHVAPALLQPGGHERARAAVPALPGGPAHDRSRSRWSRSRRTRALGIALLSYAGKINFGLVGDYDVMWDLDDFADDVRDSLDELADGGRRRAHRERGGGACTREGPARGVRPRPRASRCSVQRLEASTRTVKDAATAVGCEESEIAKSIVFVADGDPVVCVASGRHRIDTDKLADALDVAEVRQAERRRGARRHRLRDRRRAALRPRPAGAVRRGAARPRARLGGRGRPAQPVRGRPARAGRLRRARGCVAVASSARQPT